MMVRTPAGWRLFAEASGVAADKLPSGGALAVSTAAQRQRAANAVPAVVDAIQLGDTSKLGNSSTLMTYRKNLAADGSQGFAVDPACRPWGTPVGTNPGTAVVVGTPAMRLMTTGGTTLAMLSLDCLLSVRAQAGETVVLDPDLAAAEGDDGKAKDTMTRRNTLMVLLKIPAKGKTEVLGWSSNYLVPPGK